MNTQEIANRLVTLCRENKYVQAIEELYAKDIESKEPEGGNAEVTNGIEKVKEKTERFEGSIQEIHSAEISDPIVALDHFACVMDIDATYKEHGRMRMSEICVYEVKNGKIVKDEFFYKMG